MGDWRPTCPAAIDRVMFIAERERDGDHFLSHLILARKVLGESPAFAIRVANAFKHRRLTRQDCERMVDDWDGDSATQQDGEQ